MKIAEIRKLILKKEERLNKPKYVLLGNADYSELKEELEDLQRFLDNKGVVGQWTLGGMNIVAESEMLDLRYPQCSHLVTHTITTHPLAGFVGKWCSNCQTKVE